VATENHANKSRDHKHRPYGPGNERHLLLLEFGRPSFLSPVSNAQNQVVRILASFLVNAEFLSGLPSDAVPLMSLSAWLLDLRGLFPLPEARWANFTSLRARAMVCWYVDASKLSVVQGREHTTCRLRSCARRGLDLELEELNAPELGHSRLPGSG
jgi:hypothetical protein